MKIKMLGEHAVAPDHIHTVLFHEGDEYMVGEGVHEFAVRPVIAQALLDAEFAEVASGDISEEQADIQRRRRATDPAENRIPVEPVPPPIQLIQTPIDKELAAKKHKVNVQDELDKEAKNPPKAEKPAEAPPETEDETVHRVLLERRAADIKAHDGHDPINDSGGENHPSVAELEAEKVKAAASKSKTNGGKK